MWIAWVGTVALGLGCWLPLGTRIPPPGPPDSRPPACAPSPDSVRGVAAGGSVAQEARRALYLSYFVPANLSGAESEAIAAEVQRIFGEIGFEVREYTADELSGDATAFVPMLLRIVILDHGPMSWGVDPNALGATIGREAPPTAVYVFATAVRRVLGIGNERHDSLRPEEVGRAFGRVAAHEIVHAYAPDHPHTGWGITAHSQDALSLTKAGTTLDGHSARAFTEAWERITALLSPDTGRGPAASLILEVVDNSTLNPDIIGVARQEVEALLERAGVGVAWLDGEPTLHRNRPVGYRLRVVIQASEPAAWGLPPGTLGVTPREYSPARSLYVFRRPIERALVDLRYRELLGRAIGRVIVHELAHAFGCEHEESGLMAPNLAGGVLKASDVSVPAIVGETLRAGLQITSGATTRRDH